MIMLSIYLLWPGTGGYEGIGVSKYQLFILLAGGYVIIMIILGLEMVLTGQAKCLSIKKMFIGSSHVQRCLLLFLIFTVVSALLSPFGINTIIGLSRNEGLLTIALYVLCFMLVSVFGEWKSIYFYIAGTTVSLFCVLAILQLLGLNPFYLYPPGYNYYDAGIAYSGAYLGTIGNVDLVAAFLCIVAPLFLCAVVLLKGKTRFMLIFPAVLSIVVLLWMKVAAGYVGFLVGVGFSVPLLFKACERSPKIPAFIMLGLFLAAIICLFFVDIGTGTLHEIHELLHGRLEGTFGSGRLYIWNETIKLVPEHLWFGGGPDTLSARLVAPFTRYVEELGLTIVAATDVAHNEYLNILVSQGIFALISYIAALVLSAVRLLQHATGQALILGVPILCYCIQAFFGISMFFTAPYFWIVLALLEHEIYRGEIT